MKNKNASVITPIFVSAVFLLMILGERLLEIFAKGKGDVMFSAFVVELFIFAIPASFYLLVRGLSFSQHSLLRFPKFSTLPFILSSALTYFFTAVIIFYIQFNFFPTSQTSTSTVEGASVFTALLTLVIVPAFAEELFFRSIIISDYKSISATTAVIMSALFFAMLHFSFGSFIFYFIMGLILGTVTFVTGSSIPSLIIHLINNTVTVFFSSHLTSFIKESSSSVLLAFILVVAFMGSLVLMLSTMEEIYEKRSLEYESGTLPGSRRDALQKLNRAGNISKKEEKGTPSPDKVFLSPTFFVTIILFLLITFGII